MPVPVDNAAGESAIAMLFQEWIEHVFEHRDAEPTWPACHCWNADPSVEVEYLSRLFENSSELLQPYSDEQVNQGLWDLVSLVCSDVVRIAFCDECVQWPERQMCLRSIRSLFRDCFAIRCSSHLSHFDQPGANPINSVCYMWWDVFPTWGSPEDPSQSARDQEVLAIMRETLSLPSLACQESALHGLGHWQFHYPDQAKQIVDEFLARTPKIDEALLTYAKTAKTGYVQ